MQIALWIIAAVLVLFLIVVGLQSTAYRVTRKATMNAPPAAVFAQVNDFHRWEHWSPWAKIDPAMKQTYDGPASGTGAKYHWLGNKQVGEGRMTITESRPNERIVINLEFIKPFAATNTTEFTFAPHGNQTEITWNMDGKKNFMLKAMGLFMSMDKMVGGQFEQGLANMRSIVEAAAKS